MYVHMSSICIYYRYSLPHRNRWRACVLTAEHVLPDGSWWRVEEAGPGEMALLKLGWRSYCERSATPRRVPGLGNNPNKRCILFLWARQLVGVRPALLWAKRKPPIWSVHKYALTHSTPTFRNANVNWSTRGHLKGICFHGLTCRRAHPRF